MNGCVHFVSLFRCQTPGSPSVRFLSPVEVQKHKDKRMGPSQLRLCLTRSASETG
jgi:hypothetical protein